MILGEPLKRIQKCAKYGRSWAQAKTSIDYFLPLSNLPKKELLKKTSK